MATDKEALAAEDLEWLRALVERQRPGNGHCGESSSDRMDRDRREDRIDRILQALASIPSPMEGIAPSASPAEWRHKVATLIRHHVRVDATGLSPAVASVFMVGIDEAADAIASVSGGVQKENMVREPSNTASVSASPAADEWLRDGNMLYTLAETGQWRKGEPVRANRLMITVHWDPRLATDADGEALIQHIMGIARLAAGQSLNGLARDGSPALTHHSQAGSETPSEDQIALVADQIIGATFRHSLSYLNGVEAAHEAARQIAICAFKAIGGGVFTAGQKFEFEGFELDDEMRDRLAALAQSTRHGGWGMLASANYHGQGRVHVPSGWLLELLSEDGSQPLADAREASKPKARATELKDLPSPSETKL